MEIDGNGWQMLDRKECLAFLASAEVGRIAISTRALPLILPVCFFMDGEQIVISTHFGTALDGSTRDAVVAFEADGPSSHSTVGWSVHVNGIARHVTDPHEIVRLVALRPCTRLHPQQLIAISTDQLAGRSAVDADEPFDADPLSGYSPVSPAT